MKELKMYIEGLLSKSNKSSTTSGTSILIDELNKQFGESLIHHSQWSDKDAIIHFDYSDHKVFITSDYGDSLHPLRIDGDTLGRLFEQVKSYRNISEIVFEIDTVTIMFRLDLIFNPNIKLKFNNLYLMNESISGNTCRIKNINMDCKDWSIHKNIEIVSFNIKSRNTYTVKNDEPFDTNSRCVLNTKKMIFLTRESYNLQSELEYAGLILRDGEYLAYKPLSQSVKDQLKKRFYPLLFFSLNGLNIKYIIVAHDVDTPHNALIFTKKLRKYKPIKVDSKVLTPEESVIELADGWYAIWTPYDESLLK
nr:MAG TPA: hypothetical protein [Caudoviricetes sp.]